MLNGSLGKACLLEYRGFLNHSLLCVSSTHQDMASSAKLNMFLIFIHEKHKRIIQVDNTSPLLLHQLRAAT